MENGIKIIKVYTPSIVAQLEKDVKYAQRSLSISCLNEIYGMACAYHGLGLIDSKTFMDINHETIYFINTHQYELHHPWEFIYNFKTDSFDRL